MAFTVTCRNCSRLLRLPSEAIGKAVVCSLCKSVFATRATGNDRAEAVDAPPQANHPISDLLTLDSVSESENSSVADSSPSTRRPNAYASEELDEEETENRSRGKAVLLRFAIEVHHDPEERFHGLFEAIATKSGIHFWRGRGRTVDIHVGTSCEVTNQGRLLVRVEGSRIELSTLHPDGLNRELAEELADFLRERKEVPKMPRRSLGPVVALAFLPLLMPIVGYFFGGALREIVGAIVWGVVSLFLLSLLLFVVTRRQLTALRRGAMASLISLTGLLLVVLVGWLTTEPIPVLPKQWTLLAPENSGFRVEFPAPPEQKASSLLHLTPQFGDVYSVTVEKSQTAFVAAFAEVGPIAGDEQLRRLADLVQRVRKANDGELLRTEPQLLGDVNGLEFELKTKQKAKLLGRIYHSHGRFFFVAFLSRGYPLDGPHVRRFFDSFALDPTTGWPSKVSPEGTKLPVRPVPMPTEKPKYPQPLRVGGKLIYQHAKPLLWVGVPPDGKRGFALAEGNALLFFDLIEELDKGQLYVSGIKAGLTAALSPDGHTLAIPGSNGNLTLVDLATRRIKEVLKLADEDVALTAVTYSSTGKQLAIGRSDASVLLWDLESKSEVRAITLGDRPVQSLIWPSAYLVLSGDAGGTIRGVDLLNGWIQTTLKAHDTGLGLSEYSLRAVGLTRDGNSLVSAGSDRWIRGWEMNPQKSRFQVQVESEPRSLALFPSGRLFALGTAEGRVSVFETLTGKARGILRVNQGTPLTRDEITGLAFTQDGKLVITAGNRLEIWSLDQVIPLTKEDRTPLPTPTLPKVK